MILLFWFPDSRNTRERSADPQLPVQSGRGEAEPPGSPRELSSRNPPSVLKTQKIYLRLLLMESLLGSRSFGR